MSSGPVTGGVGQADEPDHTLGVAVLIRRGQRTSGVAFFWLAFGFFSCQYISNDAAKQGSPAPAWFNHLEVAFAVAAAVTLAVFFGCSIALRRRSPELRAQAAAVDRERLRQSRRVVWYRRIFTVITWAALALGAPLFIGAAAVFGGPLAVNGVAYLVGQGQVFTWSSGDMEVHSAGGAVAALVIGLLIVFGAVAYGWGGYLIVRRSWWRDGVAQVARRVIG